MTMIQLLLKIDELREKLIIWPNDELASWLRIIELALVKGLQLAQAEEELALMYSPNPEDSHASLNN